MLIVARVVQGFGAALMTPQTMAVITRIFPSTERGRAMALWGATAGVATLVGPILGGVLVDGLGWEWIFFINIPVGIIGLFLAYIIGGLREIGEPARKALITELVPPEDRTASIGLYWAVRTFSVMFMPIIGAAIWIAASPQAVFVTASVTGACGALLFAIRTQARSSASN
jgi:MFS family permease